MKSALSLFGAGVIVIALDLAVLPACILALIVISAVQFI